MELTQYRPSVYSNLLDFHVAEGISEDKKKFLPILGDIICAYNLEDKIGVCLLHKHFDIRQEEVLVRTFKNNSFVIEPKSNFSEKVLPYIWAFSESEKEHKTELYPVEFIEKQQNTFVLEAIAKELQVEEGFISSFKETITKNELTNIFGISLIPHKLFSLKAGDTLIENDVEGEKQLHISVVSAKAIKGQKTAQTLWIFDKNGTTEQKLDCTIHCGLHCGIHCGIHCGVHD